MPISGTTTNYGGRTRDLFISGGVRPLKSGPQQVSYSFGSPSSYVAGVQKLVQRYAILLVNTGLVDQLQTARGSNIQEASHLFNFASWDVVKRLKSYQSKHADLPEDEQLAGAQLEDISLGGNRLAIRVKIVTKAGDTVPYVLPIPLQ